MFCPTAAVFRGVAEDGGSGVAATRKAAASWLRLRIGAFKGGSATVLWLPRRRRASRPHINRTRRGNGEREKRKSRQFVVLVEHSAAAVWPQAVHRNNAPRCAHRAVALYSARLGSKKVAEGKAEHSWYR